MPNITIFVTVGTSALTSSKCWTVTAGPRQSLLTYLEEHRRHEQADFAQTLVKRKFDPEVFKDENRVKELPAELASFLGLTHFLEDSESTINRVILLYDTSGWQGKFCAETVESILKSYPQIFQTDQTQIDKWGFGLNPDSPPRFFSALLEMANRVGGEIRQVWENEQAPRFIINRTAGYKAMTDPLVAIAAFNQALPIDIAYLYEGVNPDSIIFLNFKGDQINITYSTDYKESTHNLKILEP